jgi:hypothetical protein
MAAGLGCPAWRRAAGAGAAGPVLEEHRAGPAPADGRGAVIGRGLVWLLALAGVALATFALLTALGG